MRLYKLDALYNETLLTKSQRNRTVLKLDADGTDKDSFTKLKSIQKDIVNFVKDGNNLYIHSAICGNGKTEWSIRLIQAYLNKIWINSDLSCHALFINVPRYLIAIKDNIQGYNEYAEHIRNNVLNADIVVWDDIATKIITTFESENLLNIIDTRMNSRKSNIFTSNCDNNALRMTLGDRLCSRIVNFSNEIIFYGKDKRKGRYGDEI